MDTTSLQYTSLVLLALIVVCGQVSAHPPSDMYIIVDPDSNSILVTLTHRVSDLSSHYVSEIELRKNGEIVEALHYTSQPSPDSFTYRYQLPLDAIDSVTVIARCNIGGEITREYRNPGRTDPDIPAPVTPPASWYSSLLPIHAALMVTAFFCFLVSALLPILGTRLKGWYRLHTWISGAGAVMMIFALGISYAMVSLSGGPNFRVPHAYLGMIILAVLLLVLGLAFIRKSVKSDQKKQVRAIHLWLGRLLVILMALNILAGLNTAGLL